MIRTMVDRIAAHPLAVLVIAYLCYFALGAGQEGMNFDSATYSVIARNMAEDGRWFNPTYTDFYHTTFTAHAPLVMWADALVFLVTGPHDWAARLFGALCTLGAIVVAFLLGNETGGKELGFLSGLVLLLTYNFIQIGNSSMLDVPVSFFMLVALWGIVRLLNNRATVPACVLTGVALAFSFLAKGVVSAPAWITLAVVTLTFRREWLRSPRFWLIPCIALGIVFAYFALDRVYADGAFVREYFGQQIWGQWADSGDRAEADWWLFSFRFLKLYFPFVILLPAGLYLLIRKRVIALYPVAIAFIVFALFSSASDKLYHHYFCPAYAFAAPLAALPLVSVLKGDRLKWVTAVFAVLWVLLCAGVAIGGVRLHSPRAPEINEATPRVLQLLRDHPDRYGLFVVDGGPNWKYVAYAAWYWRSDILCVPALEEAAKRLRSDHRFAYVFFKTPDRPSDAVLRENRLSPYYESEGIVIYTSMGGVSGFPW
ncbi:MAG: glycosyltransferase family 39 protein [Candidatus Zixiibacteriota bacterium]